MGNTLGASEPIQSEVYKGKHTGNDPQWVQAVRKHTVENLIIIKKPTKTLICLLLSPYAGNSKNASYEITLPCQKCFIGLRTK